MAADHPPLHLHNLYRNKGAFSHGSHPLSFVENDPAKIELAKNLKIRLSPIGEIETPGFANAPRPNVAGEDFHVASYLVWKHLSTPTIKRFIDEVLGDPDGMVQTLYRKLHGGTLSTDDDLRKLDEINQKLGGAITGKKKEYFATQKANHEETIITKMRLFFHPDDLWMVEDPEVLWHAYRLRMDSDEGEKVIDKSNFYISHIGRFKVTTDLQNKLHRALTEGNFDKDPSFVPHKLIYDMDRIPHLVRAIIPDETVIEWGRELQKVAKKLFWALRLTPLEIYNLREMPVNNLLINTYEKISGYVRGLAFIDSTYKVPREMKTLCEIITAIVKEWQDIATGQKVLVSHAILPTLRMSLNDIRFILSDSDVRPPPPQIASEDNLLYARYFLENGCGPTQTGYLGPEEEPAPAAPVAAATRRPGRRPRLASDSDD